jgi:hypothetical protein
MHRKGCGRGAAAALFAQFEKVFSLMSVYVRWLNIYG